MFEFLKKKSTDKTDDKKTFIEVACLLIHASKIDENYTEKEKAIISEALMQLGSNKKDLNFILEEAEKIEQDSNQILDFTRSLKNEDKETKYLIVESLWKIIFSDSTSDMYESNLMRRLTGLLYLSPKEVGDIKVKIKNSS
tara:strand:- start:348 stop:770 length:423 start_codon:yes stop_codon:yes gene_type:complete